MISNTAIRWYATSFANCTTFAQVKEQALGLYNEANGIYPLFVYTDNGRGVSAKSVRITPNYQTSRNLGFILYSLKIYEGTTVMENETVSFDPDRSYNGTAYGIIYYQAFD